MRFLFFICILFFYKTSFSQTADHTFKLSGDDFQLLKYKTENGAQVVDRYEKRSAVKEGNDSLVYVEIYSEGKHWNVYRYGLSNNKPELTGWQKEYDANGMLYSEKFCEEGKRKCKLYRSYNYYPGGQLMSDVGYYGNKREGYHFYYYANGQMRQCLEFKNNRLENVVAYYDQDGNALDVGSFCDGEGTVNIYSMNGKIIQYKTFHRGKVKKVFGIGEG
ncbi:MAG: hypothetical protein H7Y00_13745 [Fimbriimonadaceae bacterium]|nr:hypothetical protein [Chitinophagales bacterium]